jgi:hypothetical protein
MAAPHVAGLAALLFDQDPARTPATVRRLIEDGAVDRGAPGFDNDYGHGRIDVLNSLEGGGCGDGSCATPKESRCSCPADCGAPRADERGFCTNGEDDDCDTFKDCADPDCAGNDPACPCGNASCVPPENRCSCPADCGAPPSYEESCINGVDDDCDGKTDHADRDCGCGDGICAGGGEDCNVCPQDCAKTKWGGCCGDGVCSGKERAGSCPVDCAP